MCIRWLEACTNCDSVSVHLLRWLQQNAASNETAVVSPKQAAVAFLYVILCVFIYMHNSKIKDRITTFCLSNNCSTIGDIYSLR